MPTSASRRRRHGTQDVFSQQFLLTTLFGCGFAAICCLAMFDVIYRDDYLLVLDKPSGLLAVPGRGPDLQDCLSARAQREYPGALVVHRLDRDTSGLIVLALDKDAQRELSRQFAERTVEKRYIAVVCGCPAEPEGVIELPMRKDFDRPPRHMIDSVDGRPACTAWRHIQ